MSCKAPRVAGWLLLVLPALLALVAIGDASIDGIVVEAAGPVPGATVRRQGEESFATTDSRGRFRMPASTSERPITASKPGYLIATASAGSGLLRLQLEPLPQDNDDYAWIEPHPGAGQNCGTCHTPAYRDWATSAHARSARNPKFLFLYAGTDGTAPPSATWNVRAEHPLGASVCAACHAPTLASPSLDYDIREARGVDASGIHCDYCHKIAEAPTDRLGTRFGRDGLHLLRPAPGKLLSLGPLDDAVRPGEAFAALPVYRESRYCASCHEGIIFGVHAYSTYSEWLDSPARQQGRQCQDCHMAPTGTLTNIAPGHGGVERAARTLASHTFRGGDAGMLRNCLQVDVRSRASTAGVEVDVQVRAEGVGHRVPTGFVDRHLVLVVAGGAELLEGTRLPAAAGHFAGQPGWLYARQLVGADGRTPVPFWLPVLRSSDTRLAPGQPDERRFVFAAGTRRVRVELWYRRFWAEVAEPRGWRDNDVLVHRRDLEVH
jgi:hypothetical protein